MEISGTPPTGGRKFKFGMVVFFGSLAINVPLLTFGFISMTIYESLFQALLWALLAFFGLGNSAEHIAGAMKK